MIQKLIDQLPNNIYLEKDEIEVVVISTVAGQTVAKRLGIYSSRQEIIYIDTVDPTLGTVSLSSISLQTPAIEKADKMFAVNEYLLRSGIYSKVDFNYQPLANKIVAKWEAVQYSANQDIEVEFERPPLPRFIHELYKECARQCWTHAYLFKTYSTTMEQQARNRKDIDHMLDAAMDTTLDSFLPWKSIVEKYFKEPETKKSDIPPTNMMEESTKEEDEEEEVEAEKKKVGFDVEDSDNGSVVSEDGRPNPNMHVSEEECELDDVESIKDEDEEPPKEEKVTDLEASEELVLNM